MSGTIENNLNLQQSPETDANSRPYVEEKAIATTSCPGKMERPSPCESDDDVVNCAYGCDAIVKKSEFEAHLEKCRYRPNQACSAKPKIMQGSGAELNQHDQNHPKEHLNMLRDSKVIGNGLEETYRRLEKHARMNSEKLCHLEEAVKDVPSNNPNMLDSIKMSNVKQSEQGTLSLDSGMESLESIEIGNQHRQIGFASVHLDEIEIRLKNIQDATYNGTSILKIQNYRFHKAQAHKGDVPCLRSSPFFTSSDGYKMCMCVYLDGESEDRGTHISLFFSLMKGEYDQLLDWPFRQMVTLMILDQSGNDHRTIKDSFTMNFDRPKTEISSPYGYNQFALQSDIEDEKNSYIKDDVMFIKVVVK